MPSRRSYDRAALDQLAREAERVLTHAVLVGAGVSLSTVTHRLGPSGPWQRVLPGVVLLHRGTPTQRERILGALAFAGPDAVVTGLTALHSYGLRAGGTPSVDLLVPMARQRKSHGYARIERTRRLPQPTVRSGVPYAPVARAVVDACRRLERLDDVRELVAEAVQRRLCTVSQLGVEIGAAARQRTALGHAALAEIGAGIRSVAEARAREVYRRHGVPQPEWNVTLVDGNGDLIAVPDGYWRALAAALQIDSLAWHLAPSSYKRTQQRQRALTVSGVLVLPVAPSFILEDETGFVDQTRALLIEASRREPPPGIFVRREPAA